MTLVHPAPARPIEYMRSLDGLRFFAVLSVMVQHWEVPLELKRLLPWGPQGVYAFFVLSGFLITRILLKVKTDCERGATTVRTGLWRFYVRRFLRIFPLYYFVLAVLFVLLPAVRPTFLWHLLYGTNILISWTAQFPGNLTHFWSLCIEEHFYLLWPWVVLLVQRRSLPGVFVVFIAGGILTRLILILAGGTHFQYHYVSSANFDLLAFGGLLAYFWEQRGPATLDASARKALGVGLLAFLAMIVTRRLTQNHTVDSAIEIVLPTTMAFLFAGLVHLLARDAAGLVGAFLARAPLVYLGKISYGLYVYHNFMGIPSRRILKMVGVNAREWWQVDFLLRLVLTVVVAAVSWHLMESPINNLKRYFEYNRKPTPTPAA